MAEKFYRNDQSIHLIVVVFGTRFYHVQHPHLNRVGRPTDNLEKPAYLTPYDTFHIRKCIHVDVLT